MAGTMWHLASTEGQWQPSALLQGSPGKQQGPLVLSEWPRAGGLHAVASVAGRRS